MMKTVQKCFISFILSFKVSKKTYLLRCTTDRVGTGHKLHFQPKNPPWAKLAVFSKQKWLWHGWLKWDHNIYNAYHHLMHRYFKHHTQVSIWRKWFSSGAKNNGTKIKLLRGVSFSTKLYVSIPSIVVESPTTKSSLRLRVGSTGDSRSEKNFPSAGSHPPERIFQINGK